MKISNELKVGLFVVIVAVLLIGLTVRTGDFHLSQGGYELTALFGNIDGVALNSPVMLNGLEVGRVTDIRIIYQPQPQVALTLLIQPDVRVTKGVQALVKNMGFMGEKYVGLVMQPGEKEFLSAGDTIIGQEPASLEKLLREGEAIATNLKEVSGQVNERLRVNAAAIDGILANMNTTMENVASVSGGLRQHLDDNKQLIDEIVARVGHSSKNLEELSYDLKENPWKLLYKPKRER